MRKYRPSISRLVLLLMPTVSLVAQTQHRTAYTGTWKLNLAKSTYQPGTAPQSLNLRFTPEGNNIVSGVDKKGTPFEWAIPWSDGKEVPVEDIKNATAIQRIQGHTLDTVLKEAGKSVMTIHDVLSLDGKTHMGTITYVDEKGHRTQHLEFYDKQ